MKLIMESWKRFINENKEAFIVDKLTKKVKGRTVYRVKHVPSGATIPVKFYEGSANNVKALVKFLNGENFDGINSKKLSDETLKNIHNTIIKSKYKNPSFDFEEASLEEK